MHKVFVYGGNRDRRRGRIALTHKILDAALQLLPFHVAGVALCLCVCGVCTECVLFPGPILAIVRATHRPGIPPSRYPATRLVCCSCCRIILPHLLPLFFISPAAAAAAEAVAETAAPVAVAGAESFSPFALWTSSNMEFNISCYISLHAQIYCSVMPNAACAPNCNIPCLLPSVPF